MQVTLENTSASYRIHAYENGQITIAIPKQLETPPEGHQDNSNKLSMWRETLHHSFIIAPQGLLRNWGADTFDELRGQHFAQLLQYEPEVVVFGSGKTLLRPSPVMLAPLIDAGIGVEIMDTGAACRTYNILMNDERRVAAALMMI